MPPRNILKRSVSVATKDQRQQTIVTLTEALRYLDVHAGDDPRWLRTRRVLEEAKASGSLRKIRQASRAFEEAAEQLTPGSVACRLRSIR